MRSAIKTWKWASNRHAPLLAAGVAFYAFTSIFPALIAAVLCYGMVASPETVADQMTKLREVAPSDAASLITRQLDEITQTPNNSLGTGLIVALLIALWSASGGAGSLIKSTNIMFGYTETRGFIKIKTLALLLTIAAIVFMSALLALVAAAPAVLDALTLSAPLRTATEIIRWSLLVIGLLAGLNGLYRLGPNHARGHAPPLRRGVLVAATLWLAVSLGFSVYVDNFGSYGKTYGALAGVVILLLWLWIGTLAVLLGAASNRIETRQDGSDDAQAPPDGGNDDHDMTTAGDTPAPGDAERTGTSRTGAFTGPGGQGTHPTDRAGSSGATRS